MNNEIFVVQKAIWEATWSYLNGSLVLTPNSIYFITAGKVNIGTIMTGGVGIGLLMKQSLDQEKMHVDYFKELDKLVS